MSIEQIKEHFKNQDFTAVVSLADVLLAKDAGHVHALYWRACARMKLEAMDLAMDDLNLAIERYDEYADAISQRGVIFFHRGNLRRALDDMDRAVELDPENPYRYSSRAYIKSAMKELESAIADYEMAISLDPADAIAHNNLGLLQEELGYKSQAQRNLELAANLAIDPEGHLTAGKKNYSVLAGEDETEAPSMKPSYLQVIRDVFTTREGFKGYWKYLKKVVGGK